MATLDFEKINELADTYKSDMTRFLRDMVAIPSESCNEEKLVLRIKEEMEKVGFDKVEIDPMGNVLGYIGSGPRLIAFDAHIDTVGVGVASNWNFDPYKGYEDDECIGGRGTSDQEGGMASMVYAGKIIKDLGLDAGCTVLMTGTVQEEDCDGLCWQYIINELGLKPEFVVSTEPTDGGIYRGQRGRMEIRVEVEGVSAHGSAPERGDNAIFKMAKILNELEALNETLKDDDFLGKGSLTVSQIFYTSPSRCAVADGCAISIDRRLTAGEDKALALSQIAELPAAKAAGAKVTMYKYDTPAYTGLVYPTDCYFPSWIVEEDHPAVQATASAYTSLFNADPRIDKWTFSTNGVAITGMHGIPTVGFGPGKEAEAHAPNEKTWKADLVRCAALYAALPSVYTGEEKTAEVEEKQLAVIAIGGNSLIQHRDKRTVQDQYLAICETTKHLVDLVELGYQLVVTHGNGPQVGFIMLRSEIAREQVGLHIVPLSSCVADTQGAIGLQIQQALADELEKRKLDGKAVTIVTQVEVDPTDSDFVEPNKPIGEFYLEEQLPKLRQQHPEWILKQDANRGYRRVVASPAPIKIVENDAINALLENGHHIITAGGGGVPVVRSDDGLSCVDAVIDKDKTAALLANDLGAPLLVISTAVEQVMLNFGTADEKPLGLVTAVEMETYLNDGHFAPGSMGPKIEAAIDFIKNGGQKVIITSPENIGEAIRFGKGTQIIG